MSRNWTYRRVTKAVAAMLTAGLLCTLLFFYMRYDRVRTLRNALEGIDGDPVAFSVESGFYQAGPVLKLDMDARIPEGKGIEIRYTVDGGDPTGESILYDPEKGIDLQALADAAAEAEKEQAALREEAVAKAREEAEDARLEAEAAQTAGAAQAAEKTQAPGAAQSTDTAQTSGTAQAAEMTQAPEAGKMTPPTVEEARRDWEMEKWLLASDAGVYPERTDDGTCVLPIRACLVQGEDRSRAVTRTYVVGKNAAARYAKVYVVSVVTDDYNLFDYDNGIMVKGSHYEEDVADGVREDRAGNFYQTGDEWVKDGHVTLFSPEGAVLMEEDAGLTISGYSSRTLTTRSFKAEASPQHGSSGDYFHLDIFAEEAGEAGGPDASIDLFQKIKFRSHGVPNYHIRSVRNQYAKILTDACGFPGLVENRLGVMFLNGEFYTVCDIAPSTTRDYLSRLFGLGVPDAVEKFEGSDYDVYTRAKIVKLFEADLTQAVNRQALERAVDMDNYLFYMALEVLFNNADWPFNNVTMWRYLGEQDPSNPYSDGRFRFLIDDMDQILSNGLHGDPDRWSSELIDYLMRDKGHTFSHVMACTEYRDRFLTYVDDLLQTAFEPAYACGVLDELYGAMREEYLLDYGPGFWAEMEETWEITKQNVREKESLYRADIGKYMGLSARVPVTVEPSEGVTVTWNNMEVSPGGSWTNAYYSGTSLVLTAAAADGYTFAGWEVDGRMQTGEPSLVLAIGDEAMTVRAVAKKAP